MQVLILGNHIGREDPAVPALDNQVQRAVELAVQPAHVALLVGLGDPADGGLDGDDVLGVDDLCVVADAGLGVLEEGLDDALLVAELIADAELVVPRLGALAVVDAQLLGDGALAVLNLEVPVEAAGRVGLVVDAGDEGGVETLLEAFLVEEEGVLKRVQLARHQRRPGEDHAGAYVVWRRRGASGGRRGIGAGSGSGSGGGGGGVEA